MERLRAYVSAQESACLLRGTTSVCPWPDTSASPVWNTRNRCAFLSDAPGVANFGKVGWLQMDASNWYLDPLAMLRTHPRRLSGRGEARRQPRAAQRQTINRKNGKPQPCGSSGIGFSKLIRLKVMEGASSSRILISTAPATASSSSMAPPPGDSGPARKVLGLRLRHPRLFDLLHRSRS